jgi:hypothetical protein
MMMMIRRTKSNDAIYFRVQADVIGLVLANAEMAEAL